VDAKPTEDAQRLVDRALELEPAERPGFIARETAANEPLRAAAQELLSRLYEPNLGTRELQAPSLGDRQTSRPSTQGRHEYPTQPIPKSFDTQYNPVDVVEEEEDAFGDAAASDLRYELGRELGRGGMGVVVAAHDRRMRRTVAFKLLKAGVRESGDYRRRFIREAQITSQLEHPSIIPIYDLGTLSDNQLYYSMRVVRSPSLGDVLYDPVLRADWSLVRLLNAFVQVCRAVAYAHARRIIHRDLKPSNVLLGDYGEIYVADWGLAKVIGREPHDRVEESEPLTSRGDADTQVGIGLGTPGYMSPEQALGEWESVDHRSDIFALGVVLFEILTGEQPFAGETAESVVAATINASPPRPRRVSPRCPLLLEDLCLKMLSRRKEQRPESAEAVAREIEAFLEGSRERERRRREAESLVERARASAQRYQALGEERTALLRESKVQLAGVQPWDSPDRKLVGWELEDRARRVEIDQARALAEAIELYSQALGYDSDNRTARAGLADLYWERSLEAEASRNEAARVYSELRVREFDDGRYAELLDADTSVSIRTDPPGASVAIYRYAEQNRVLLAGAERHFGQSPVTDARLAPGSYLALIRMEGYRDVRAPMLCRRGERVDLEVVLRREEEIGRDFVYVPGGPALVGGGHEAYNAIPRHEATVGDFAIGVFPIRYSEYLAFVNDLQTHDPEEAERRAPAPSSGASPRVRRELDGRWVVAWDRIVDWAARKYCPFERASDLPVDCVNYFDAVAYCDWRSERDGARYRLATEVEWEKAARGVDGRYFPWGDGFDASFCKMRESRSGPPQPEPAGAFVTDRSPYGARDMAGGMRSWVADVYGVLDIESALAEADPSISASRRTPHRVIRGGAWTSGPLSCYAASRIVDFSTTRAHDVGFRIVKELTHEDEQDI
jgi:serine/threonine protein kinase/formylglycine-generating enzyme required for sulfatase activity